MQDTSEPQEIGPDEALIFGELFKGPGRCLKQSLVCETLLRADQGTQGLRDSAGQEKVRPRELLGQVVLEPLLGFMLLTLGAVAVATGMIDAVLARAVLTLIEAVTVYTTLALLDGADDLTVCGKERRIALQVLWSKSREDRTQGDHGKSPCMKTLKRS